MSPKKDIIYLTFRTDRETHEFLKNSALVLNKTQQELINDICKGYINFIKKGSKKMEEAKNNSPETSGEL